MTTMATREYYLRRKGDAPARIETTYALNASIVVSATEPFVAETGQKWVDVRTKARSQGWIEEEISKGY